LLVYPWAHVRPIPFLKLGAAAILWALQPWTTATAQSIRFNRVSREVVETRLRQYAGNDTKRETALQQLFAEAGCDQGHLSEQAVKGSKLPNVICTLPGESDRVIIVGAHFDHVANGDGVVDNWSGASLLPSLYEAVKVQPRRHTYIFVGFTDEERGEIGSAFYVQRMTEQQVAATDAMVNMDTLGLAPTEVWASCSDQRLTGALVYLGEQLDLTVTGVNVEQVGSTGSEQFAKRYIPSITIHLLTQQTWNERILRTSKDKLSAMQLDDYYQAYRLLSAYLAFLDQFWGAPEVKAAN
jgi:Peptidase family M28